MKRVSELTPDDLRWARRDEFYRQYTPELIAAKPGANLNFFKVILPSIASSLAAIALNVLDGVYGAMGLNYRFDHYQPRGIFKLRAKPWKEGLRPSDESLLAPTGYRTVELKPSCSLLVRVDETTTTSRIDFDLDGDKIYSMTLNEWNALPRDKLRKL